jgi:alcohol dehydrogenase (NADP+)
VLSKWISKNELQREEIFIITKLPPEAMTREGVSKFLSKSLSALDLGCVDMYLVHIPIGVKPARDGKTHFPLNEEGNLDLDMDTDLIAVWKV